MPNESVLFSEFALFGLWCYCVYLIVTTKSRWQKLWYAFLVIAGVFTAFILPNIKV